MWTKTKCTKSRITIVSGSGRRAGGSWEARQNFSCQISRISWSHKWAFKIWGLRHVARQGKVLSTLAETINAFWLQAFGSGDDFQGCYVSVMRSFFGSLTSRRTSSAASACCDSPWDVSARFVGMYTALSLLSELVIWPWEKLGNDRLRCHLLVSKTHIATTRNSTAWWQTICKSLLIIILSKHYVVPGTHITLSLCHLVIRGVDWGLWEMQKPCRTI